METFKVGDIVARKSYNFDIMFKIVGIKNDIVDLVRDYSKDNSRCSNFRFEAY